MTDDRVKIPVSGAHRSQRSRMTWARMAALVDLMEWAGINVRFIGAYKEQE